MSATSVRNALLTQLQADTALIAEFTAPQIKKGVELHFDVTTATKGLRVAMELSNQRLIDILSSRVEATYGFSLLAYFYETDVGAVDDRMALYDELIREAVEKTLDLGINATRLLIGQTRYRQHQKVENLYFAVIPVSVHVRETRGAR